VADVTSAAGLKYRNGFLHGVRYTCSRCRVDFVDVTDPAATAFTAEAARMNATLSSDVVYAAPGAAGEAALLAAAQAGAWVIGSQPDLRETVFQAGAAPGAHEVVTSAYLDYATAVARALEAYQAGEPPAGAQPLSAANGAVVLAPVEVAEAEDFTDLDRQDVQRALERLASGELDTGVDPVTGQEL
jgi:basic membrane lipoprotein Med (substrate-binding protein (PBP1-ABC) superfamily)